MTYELNQIIEFIDEYPEGLYDFIKEKGYTLTELEPTTRTETIIDEDGNEQQIEIVVRRVKIIEIPEESAEEKRQRLDGLTLTPADVERALYKAKTMDFEDLKTLIAQQLPNIDIKGLAIEFRAKDFYRGAEANGIRLFDVVGQLLGYTSDDMDYLFEHGELPAGNE